jgi:hypothetical protein
VLKETWSVNQVEIELEQNRFLSDGSVFENSPIWKIPLFFATNNSKSSQYVLFEQKIQTFIIPLNNDDTSNNNNSNNSNNNWIKINAGQKALVRVAHSVEMVHRLKIAIKNKSISAIDRAALLLDSYALAKANLSSLETVIDILKSFEDEDNATVFTAIAGVLNGFYTLFEQLPNNDVVFDKFLQFGKSLVVKALQKVGWDAKNTDDHTDKLLRATVLGLLDTFAWNDEEVVKEAKKRFDLHWTDASALPNEYKVLILIYYLYFIF